MNWLISIFSEKAQQAQLVTMLLSVTVAVSVVLLNQWFLTRRARKETLINKLEALYVAIDEYDEVCSLYLRVCYSSSKPSDSQFADDLGQKTQLALKKIGLYVELYFPEELFEIDKYKQVPLLTFLKYETEKDTRHSQLPEEALEKLRKEHSEQATKLANHAYEMKGIVVKLMNAHKH